MKINWENTINNFKGKWCCGGIDLSSVSDFTCCVYLFPRDDDREFIDVIMRTWCPESMLYEKTNKYKTSYQEWADAGWMHVTEGNAIDYDAVLQRIILDSKVFKMGLFGVDAQFQGVDFSIKLADALGHSEKIPKVISCYNTVGKMGPICQEFERRLLKRKINHGDNPIFRFMADSVTIRTDSDGNKKPDKDKSQGKIDGIVSLLYALGRLMHSKPPRKLKMPVAV